MGKTKEQRGITLIALVITIIVLIILAAATLGVLTGDNGIITRAINAKQETKDYSENELVNLITSKIRIEEKTGNNVSQEMLQSLINEEFGENKATGNIRTNNEVTTYIISVIDGNTYTITREGVVLGELEDVTLNVQNNNDEITVEALGIKNIKDIRFFNENNETVMIRTNNEETNSFTITTRMSYAGNYKVKAYDVEDNESSEKSITVESDREYTYLYNKGTISNLAKDFKYARNTSPNYSGGTFQKNTDNLYFLKNNQSGHWATSGFLSENKIDVKDYSVLTYKFKPTSRMTSSNSQYPQISKIGLVLTEEAPSNSLSGIYYGNFPGTRAIIQTPQASNSTLYLTEDHYDVAIGSLEDSYHIGLCAVGTMWMTQNWYIYCTEIYLH